HVVHDLRVGVCSQYAEPAEKAPLQLDLQRVIERRTETAADGGKPGELRIRPQQLPASNGGRCKRAAPDQPEEGIGHGFTDGITHSEVLIRQLVVVEVRVQVNAMG